MATTPGNSEVLKYRIEYEDYISEGLKEVTSQVENLDDQFKDMGGSSGGISQVEEGFKGLAGLAFGGLLLAFGAIGGSVTNLSKEFSDLNKTIQVQLGESGQAAEETSDIIKNVYFANFGDSVEEVSKAVIESKRQLGEFIDSASELENVTQNALLIASSFDKDVNEVLDASKVLMKELGLSSEEALSFITQGFQSGLDISDDFLDSIREYAVQFGEGEATAQDFYNVLQRGLSGGVLGTDKAADSFKTFRETVLDGSKATEEALAILGLNMDDFVGKIESGEMTITDAFREITTRIGETESPTGRMISGVQLLGSQFGDLGDDAIAALGQMGDELKDSNQVLGDLQKDQETFGSFGRGMWRDLQKAIMPFTDQLLDLVIEVLPSLQSAGSSLGGIFLEVFRAFGGEGNTSMSDFSNILINILDMYENRFLPVMKENVMPAVYELAGAFKELVSTGQIFWENNKDLIIPVIELLATVYIGILIHAISSVIQSITFWINKLGELLNFLNNVRNGINSFKDFVINAFLNISSAITSAWSGVANMVKGQFNEVVNVYNKGVGAINSAISKIASIPGVGGAVGNLSLPTIPGFKNGGDFIVPQGYDKDNFLMGVSSGERVQVTPASQVNETDNSKKVEIGKIEINNNNDYLKFLAKLEMLF